MAKNDAASLTPGEEVNLPDAPALPPADGPAVLGVSEKSVTVSVRITPDIVLRGYAEALKGALSAARAAGYVVDLPFPETALDAIAISETAKVNA